MGLLGDPQGSLSKEPGGGVGRPSDYDKILQETTRRSPPKTLSASVMVLAWIRVSAPLETT